MYALLVFVFLCLVLFTVITYCGYRAMQKDNEEIHRLAEIEKSKVRHQKKEF